MKRYLTILIVLLALGMLLTGCGKFTLKGDDGEKIKLNFKDIKDGKMDIETEDKDGERGSFSIDADEKDGSATMKMDTGDGEFDMKVGEDTELPEGFPEDFPIPDDAQIEMANTLTEDDHIAYSVHFIFDGNAEDIYKAVKGYAGTKGMEADLDNQSEADGQKSYMFNAGNEEGEYFSFNLGLLEENRVQVIYGVPK